MVGSLRHDGNFITFPTVVLLLHQVVSGPEGHEVSVVGGGGDRDGARAADVGVAQLVRQLLQLVCLEPAQRHDIRYGSQTKSRSLDGTVSYCTNGVSY